MLDKTVEKIKHVEELRKQGMGVEEASKKAGIHFSTYFAGRRQLNLPKPKRKYIKRSLAVQSPPLTLHVNENNERVLFFMGDKDTLNKLMEKL